MIRFCYKTQTLFMDYTMKRIYNTFLYIYFLGYIFTSTLAQTEDKNCICKWSDWMENDVDESATSQDLTYTTLRNLGNNFCEQPSSIECQNVDTGKQDLQDFSTCNVKTGYNCLFFCSPYKIRVECCYCPPEAIGPKFQIQTQNGLSSCLSVPSLPNSSTAIVSVDTCTDIDGQNWQWTSKANLKNLGNQQCLAVTDDEKIITQECNGDDKQNWKYIHKNTVLQFVKNKKYLNYRKDNKKLRLYTSRGDESKWLALLDIGETTSLKNLQNPKCEPQLDDPVNGIKDCTLGSYVSSVCTFQCDYGYAISEGAKAESRCTEDAEFDNPTPTCEQMYCEPVLTAPDNGNVSCTNANKWHSTCRFECNLGYKIANNQDPTLSCYEPKKWDADPPICQQITCDPNISTEGLTNGKVNCTKANYFNSICRYSCLDGFELIGAKNHECQVDGKWNDTKPVCQKIECPSILPPANGKMSCDSGRYYNSNCNFNCNRGYTMDGSGSATCSADKTWTTEVPICQRQECNALSAPSGGKMTCIDDNFYDSSCTFSCNYGYHLEGDAVLKCTEEGWNKGVPTCSKIVCKQLSSIVSGNVECTNEENFESVCTFTCDTGYKLMPDMSNTLKCGENGWNNEAPKCQKIACPAVTSPSNGILRCPTGIIYNSICVLTCNSGYKPTIDPPIIQCLETEIWSQEVPSCRKIQCRKLQSLRSGRMSCTDENNFGSTCTFTCNSGYNLFGTDEATCKENGWDSEMPNCAKRSCSPPLARPDNGQINCNTSGSPRCTFSCSVGYTLVGAEMSYCQADETWSNTETRTCNRIQCTTSIRSPSNGLVTCTDGKMYNSRCSFKCNEGYNLNGDESISCMESTKWSGKSASCDRISCPPKVDILNGESECSDGNFYQSQCVASCNKGFKIMGKITSKCQLNATWTATDPVCERIMCKPVFTNPSNGKASCSDTNNYGSQCQFTCDEGFTLEGSASTVCEGGGWTKPKPPECKKIVCPAELNTGNVIGFCNRANEYLSECKYSCTKGYKLIGSATRQCTNKATWSADIPVCQKIHCPEISVSGKGRFSCTMANEYASECFGICDIGFRLKIEVDGSLTENLFYDDENLFEGSATASPHYLSEEDDAEFIKCSANGLWNGLWSNVSGSCIKIECPKIEQPNNGGIVCDDRDFGEACYIFCDDGYTRNGQSEMKCTENGTWDPAEPSTCEPSAILVASSTIASTTRKTTKPTTKTTTTEPPTTTKSTTTTTIPPTTKVVTTKLVIPETVQVTNTTKSSVPPRGINGLTTNSVTTLNTTVQKPSTMADTITSPEGGMSDSENGDTTNVTIKESEFPLMIVIIVAAIAVLLILAIVIFFIWRKKSNRNKPKFTASSLVHDTYMDAEANPLLVTNGNGSLHMKSIYVPIPIDRLEMEYNKRRSDDDKMFREEFHSFQESNRPKNDGGKAHNKEKNRYTNILPYDHSRVILQQTDENGSDYINASFIDGYKHKGKFIAAQGPKFNTIDDFWRMIWGQNVSVIIMVTNLDERNEEKCARYWPMSGRENFGDISVTLTLENHLVDFSIRKFTIQQVRGDSTLGIARNLTHYHFTSWPDFGVPKTPSGMLKFIRRIKHDTPAGFGAMVVHCSAGVGRTGTFIAIDAMMEMLMNESKIDVHNFVANMRQQRPEMVQTEQQYIFIYQAMLEHHLYGDTEVEVNEVSSHIEDLMQRLPGNVTGMEHEFKKLTSIRIQKENMRAGNNPANMRKNRVLLILPYDSNRVILPMKRGQENTDYINASYIDGYRQKDAYIATQGPLPHTVEDLWRMVWDVQAASIVMLTELVERGQAKCARYWPDENTGTEAYGDLRIEKTNETDKEDYTEREFTLSSALEGPGVGRQQIVKQFHYHGWPEIGSPTSGYSMITLIEDVQRQQQSSGNHPIVIHCSAGAGRTGAFCALITALEQVKAEGVLDIFQIVKCLRIQRPHMVQNLEQYEFCYRTVQEYIDSMSEYYNFK